MSGAQRAAVQLVEGVGADADGEEEGHHRRHQPGHVHVRGDAAPR